MLELLKSGEPFLFANIGVALVALAITIQRVHALWFKFGRSVEEMLKEIFGFLESGSFARALQLCNAHDHPINSIFKSALLRANRSEKEIRRAVEVAAISEMPRLRRGTGYMPQMSNIATLFGLIGTIRGLIISFSGVAGGDAATRQAMLSQGISIAFYNTFFGLTVAVLIIIAYMFILGKQNKLMGTMELGSAKLIDQLLVQQAMGKEKAQKRPA
ncbi:MAG: MotA/TolQ/ExbB proton channel family protein [Deltaproteobacteria bacterium]|nr:MotA/TolQ/ExbB proton channel family protein [Deltaproteobacteria bacterium]